MSTDRNVTKNPRVSDPLIVRAERDGPEFEVRPCSGKHRNYFLSGYLVLSCRKCAFRRLDEVEVS